ncbi:MAG: hypothetical protein JXJ19_09060 [Elusimicrobia bacterium]|nr:hypothetical protein [Elusimicrobiota bacterium]
MKNIILIIMSFFLWSSIYAAEKESLLEVTPDVKDYAVNIVKPIIDAYPEKDRLSQMLKISEILIDKETGVNSNSITPVKYMVYNKLEKVHIGFLSTFKLSNKQKKIIKDWNSKYMQSEPSKVFFSPSADEIIKTRAAFGCTHYARAFIGVVKALGLINSAEDLRYTISCKADDYNEALEKNDSKMTINGHQFVIVKINSRWYAVNTSKGESVPLPEEFSPESIIPPHNIPIKFKSYSDITFLLRKVGQDYNDDCGDDNLMSLMNISRSGDPASSKFKWEKFNTEK